MTSRGLYYGLLVGLAIAVPSGMGVALSVLGENTSSLVGVAISASLLPPAVNCGMAFAYAAIGFSVDTNIRDDDTRAFTNAYEYVNLGGISLALTIVNIAAIFASGLIMFRLKDVNPAKHKIAFWQVRGEEIKAYRKHNSAQIGIYLETLNGDDNNILKAASANKMLRKELLGIYKHSSIDTTNEEVLNSRNTIRPNRGNRSSEHRPEGSVKNMFNDMENQMKSPAGVNGFLTSHRSV